MLPVAKGKASTDAWLAASAALGVSKEEGRCLEVIAPIAAPRSCRDLQPS